MPGSGSLDSKSPYVITMEVANLQIVQLGCQLMMTDSKRNPISAKGHSSINPSIRFFSPEHRKLLIER